MRRRSEHLWANRLLYLDYLLGLRGYGLIIYGALPASLGALGAFKAPDQAVLSSKIGLAVLPFICCVALIPVVLTFVLVRQRLANWYLLPTFLNARAAVITIAIIIVSSLVCGANGLLVGNYRFLSLAAWSALSFGAKVRPVAECLLLSFAYLVGTNTLFLTVVKEDGNLPLLPGKQEVEDVCALRGHLVEIEKSDVQSKQPAQDEGEDKLAARVAALTKAIDEAATVLLKVAKGYTGLGRERLYEELSTELNDLKAAALDVQQTRLNWRYFWAPGVEPTNEDHKKWRASIAKLKGLRLNA